MSYKFDEVLSIRCDRLIRLVEEGGIMTAQHIADLEPARRTAILVAQVAHLDTRVTDATLAMFEKYIGSLFTKARSKDECRFQATKRDVAKALLLFRRTIAAPKRAKQAGEDGVAAVEREVGMAQLDRALPTIEAVADVADQDILLTAAEKYSVLRRFSPRSVDFDRRSAAWFARYAHRYLRRLLVLGATAVIRHARTKATAETAWLRGIVQVPQSVRRSTLLCTSTIVHDKGRYHEQVSIFGSGLKAPFSIKTCYP